MIALVLFLAAAAVELLVVFGVDADFSLTALALLLAFLGLAAQASGRDIRR